MISRLREILRTKPTQLQANAFALGANQVLSAGLGLIYWMLAARLYGADVVGTSSAVISTLLLISGVAELGLNGGMVRFLPRAGHGTRRLIALSYGASIAMAALLSVVFLLLGGGNGSLGLRSIFGTGSLVAVWVISAAVLRSIFRLQDAVLAGLKQAKWVLIENTIYNAAKIVILIAGARLLGDAGIVGSWYIPTPIVIVLCTWLIFGVFTRADRIGPDQPDTVPLTLREVAISSGGDHVGSLVAEASQRLLPLLIVALLGAAANAYFYQAWLVAMTWGLLAGGMTDSFIAEAASDRANIARYSRDILRQMMTLILPGAVVVAFGAPLVLALFGKAYATEGTPLLRWLCVAAPVIIFNTWFLAYARVIGRIKLVVTLQVVSALLLMALSYLSMRPLGITGVGLAWILSQSSIAIVGLISARETLFGRHRRIEVQA